MADLDQFVNLTRNDKWLGGADANLGVEDIPDKGRMGIWARVRITMTNRRRARLRVKKEAGGDNVAYSATERPRRRGFRVALYDRRAVRTNSRGEVTLTLGVSLAGGDEFPFTVTHRGNEVQADTLHTRRRLYFQIIKMQGVTAVSASDVQAMQNELWNTGEKVYVQIVEYTPGRTIPSRRNYDDLQVAVSTAVEGQVRGQFDRSKMPYAFVTLVCRRNGISGQETRLNIPFNMAANATFTTNQPLFDVVDPAVPYYGSLTWTPNGGAPQNIPVGSLSRAGGGNFTIRITNVAGLTLGPGRLSYTMTVCTINGLGFSQPSNNYTLVASQDAVTGASLNTTTTVGVLSHEIGHKMGMVPGGPTVLAADLVDPVPNNRRPVSDRHYLDRQTGYYWARGHNGGHCHHGTALVANFMAAGVSGQDCVMFGDNSSNTTNFCSDCHGSLRKLDLRSRTNRGIRTAL